MQNKFSYPSVNSSIHHYITAYIPERVGRVKVLSEVVGDACGVGITVGVDGDSVSGSIRISHPSL